MQAQAEEALDALEAALRAGGLTIAVGESCTGGLVAAALTDRPGSSDFFLGSVVSYANGAKLDLLGVSQAELEQHGAVSEPVARMMAEGARHAFGADVGVAVTGIAGPASEGGKPVGLTYVAASRGDTTLAREYLWHGDRAANRGSSVEAALSLAVEVLS